MKTTYQWLREYCDFDLDVEQLAHRLTLSGLEVESIHPVGVDYCLEMEVTTNRPDLLGAIGIAREVAALTGRRIERPPAEFATGKDEVGRLAGVAVRDFDLCPRYTARVIRGVRVGPSPDWLRERLEAIGLRSVNNVVDVTNYVMMECGQPIHAFDFDKLAGPKIIVRCAREGETLASIDGKTQALAPDMLVIADTDRPVAVAGVMGGLDTEVSDATTNVLLESAQFDARSVRRTSRALGLFSDASYRFERGVDPEGVEWASRRAMRLMREVADGEIADGVIDVRLGAFKPTETRVRVSRLRKLLGIDIAAADVRRILESLEFDVRSATGDEFMVVVPSWRSDVYREVDLIEEVARINGFESVPDRTRLPIQVGATSKRERVVRAASQALVGWGFCEVMTNSFCDREAAALISPWTDYEPLELRNPVRRDERFLRRTLLANLLFVKKTNAAHGTERAEIFEISKVYLPRPGEKLPDERTCLAILEEDGWLQLTGVVQALVRAMGIEQGLALERLAGTFFDETCAARLTLDGRPAGVMGLVRKTVAGAVDLASCPCVAELDFDLLVKRANLDKRFQGLPSFPAVERDVAIVVVGRDRTRHTRRRHRHPG